MVEGKVVEVGILRRTHRTFIQTRTNLSASVASQGSSRSWPGLDERVVVDCLRNRVLYCIVLNKFVRHYNNVTMANCTVETNGKARTVAALSL